MKLKTARFSLLFMVVLLVPIIQQPLSESPQRIDNLKNSDIGVTERWSYLMNYNTYYGDPTAADLDQDGLFEILVGDEAGNFYCVNSSGDLVWMKTCSAGILNKPAVADVDNDGYLEIFISDLNSALYCWEHDGTQKWRYNGNAVYPSSPAIGDVNHDGALEIVYGDSDDLIKVLDADMNLLITYSANESFRSDPLIGDIDGDGTAEIMAASYDGYMYRWSFDGTVEGIYDVEVGINGTPSYSSPAGADIDNDGDMEVVIGSKDGYLYCLDGTSNLTEWQYLTGDEILSSPAVGDIDNDGTPEVLFGSDDGNLYCLDGFGNLEWLYDTSTIKGSPVLADLDDDGNLEVIFGSDSEKLSCLDHEGNLLWDYFVDEDIMCAPCIVDIDNDGIFEILFVSEDGMTLHCLDLTGVSSCGDSPWPTGRGSAFNTGIWDVDSDGIDDFTESYFSTDKNDDDSDDDGLKDGFEILSAGSNPTLVDTDGDNLPDGDEIYIYGTRPGKNDTEDDGMPDDWEIYYNLDPTLDDSNGDGDGDELINLYEFQNSTYPNDPDTDNDEMPDGWEVTNSLNPHIDDSEDDEDGDNLSNLEEYQESTNPFAADSDGDEFNDDVEVNLRTHPQKDYWYPMPNLAATSETLLEMTVGGSFVVNLTVKNTGIWNSDDVLIIITCASEQLVIYNNSATPLDLEVDENFNILETCSYEFIPGQYIITIEIDPYDAINETYSMKDGSLRASSEEDNIIQIILNVNESSGNFPRFLDQLPTEVLIAIVVGLISLVFFFLQYFIRKLLDKKKKINDKTENKTKKPPK